MFFKRRMKQEVTAPTVDAKAARIEWLERQLQAVIIDRDTAHSDRDASVAAVVAENLILVGKKNELIILHQSQAESIRVFKDECTRLGKLNDAQGELIKANVVTIDGLKSVINVANEAFERKCEELSKIRTSLHNRQMDNAKFIDAFDAIKAEMDKAKNGTHPEADAVEAA